MRKASGAATGGTAGSAGTGGVVGALPECPGATQVPPNVERCRTASDCTTFGTDADVHGCAPAKSSTDGYTCPAGFTCFLGTNMDVHDCVPVDCTGGAFKCPLNTDCDPSSAALHHCAMRSCSSDTACDCGACVQSTCQDRLFVCSPPPPP